MSTHVDLTSVNTRVEIPLCEQDYDLYARITPSVKHSTSVIEVSSSYMGSNKMEPYSHQIEVNNHILARSVLPSQQSYECADLKTEYYESFTALRSGTNIALNGITKTYGNITKYQLGSNGILAVEVDSISVVLPGKTLQGRLVDLSPDGRLLLLQQDELMLVDTTLCEVVKRYPRCVTASLAGSTLAIAYENYVMIDDTKLTITGCNLLTVSPDGCVAVIAGNYLLLWNDRIIFERTIDGITSVACNNNIVAVVANGVPLIVTDTRITPLSQQSDGVLFTVNNMLWVRDHNKVTRYTLVGNPTPRESQAVKEVPLSIVDGDFVMIGPNYLGIRGSVTLDSTGTRFAVSTIVAYDM